MRPPGRIAAAALLAAATLLFAQLPPGDPKDPHAPLGLESACPDCHRTSGGAVVAHEFARTVEEGCFRCHTADKLGRSHPWNVDPRKARPRVDVPPEIPLEDGLVSCGSCHQPHLAWLSTTKNFAKQLPEPGGGEPRYRTYFLRVPGDPVDGFTPLCKRCHRTY